MLVLSRRDVMTLLTLRDCIDEITIFDSSGVALEDVAAAIVVYEKARASRRGTEVTLDD
jgi:ornithine cyclodeaminase/alanine dehydrogenase-like protein (mu-crystallin family)